MPIYEYQCMECGYQTEVLQKISDEPLKDCPECGKLAMKKMVTAAAFRLKGGGWYETDFKSGKKNNVHDAGEASKADSKSSDKAASNVLMSRMMKSALASCSLSRPQFRLAHSKR